MENVMTAIRLVPLDHYLILSFLLFSIGMVGALVRRNIIIVIMCLELMLNSVNLLLVAFSAYHSDPGGQIMVFLIMLVAAAEVRVGVAILVLVKGNTNGVDMKKWKGRKW